MHPVTMTPNAKRNAPSDPKLPPPTKTVERWEDVPHFDNEDDEARFWADHGLGGEALASMGSDPSAGEDELPPKRAATVRRTARGVRHAIRAD